jgi:hypothetical protein
MQTSAQSSPPAAAALAPAVAQAGKSITFVGPDGKTQTILLPVAPPALAGTEVAPPQRTDDYLMQGVVIGGALVALVFAAVAAYRRFKRRKGGNPTAQIPAESAERLERLERGMEAIAIEIERISEGQRFVTKLLSDSHAPAIPAERSQSAG